MEDNYYNTAKLLLKKHNQRYNIKDFIIGEASLKNVYLGKICWYDRRGFGGTASITFNNGNWYVMRLFSTASITVSLLQ